MDSKEHKPQRPHLFENSPLKLGATGSSPPLQGVAGDLNQVRHPATGTERGARKWWPWALLTVAAMGVVGWAVVHEERVVSPVPTVHMSASRPSDVGNADAGPVAVLVGEESALPPQPQSPSPGEPQPMSGVDSVTRGRSADLGAVGDETLASVAASPAPAAAKPERVVSRPPAPVRSRAPSKHKPVGKNPDLLETLLANIRAQPAAAEAAAANPKTLDELIALLRHPEETEPESVASNGGSGEGSAKLQAQLRACPAGNTLNGIRCRQQLCKKHQGDPACPL